MNNIKFNHWKDKLPVSGEGRSLLMWVSYDGDNDNALTTTGVFYKAYEEGKDPAMFQDYHATLTNGEFVSYEIINGELIDNSDGGKVDLYWAYDEPVYGKNPFKI